MYRMYDNQLHCNCTRIDRNDSNKVANVWLLEMCERSIKRRLLCSASSNSRQVHRLALICVRSEKKRRDLKQYFRLQLVEVVAVESVKCLWKYGSCEKWQSVLSAVVDFALISDISSSKEVRSVLLLFERAAQLKTFVFHVEKLDQSYLIERFLDRHISTLERVSITCQFGRRYFPRSCLELIECQILPVEQADVGSFETSASSSSDEADDMVSAFHSHRWSKEESDKASFHFDYNAYNITGSADEEICMVDSCDKVHVRVRRKRRRCHKVLSEKLVAWIVLPPSPNIALKSLHCGLPTERFITPILNAMLPQLEKLSLFLTEEDDDQRFWLLITHCMPKNLKTLEVIATIDDSRRAIASAISKLPLQNLFLKINDCVNEDYISLLLENKQGLEKLQLDFVDVKGIASVIEMLERCCMLSEVWLCWNADIVGERTTRCHIFDPLLSMVNLKYLSIGNFADSFDESLCRLVQFHPTLLVLSCKLTWKPYKAIDAAEQRAANDTFCFILMNEMDSYADGQRHNIICSKQAVDFIPVTDRSSITSIDARSASFSSAQLHLRQTRCSSLRRILTNTLINFENTLASSVRFLICEIAPSNFFLE